MLKLVVILAVMAVFVIANPTASPYADPDPTAYADAEVNPTASPGNGDTKMNPPQLDWKNSTGGMDGGAKQK
ncbi:hypothetical protein FQR65_LT07283 [Abscondita terminalis]|nr:hypothetical protein FQR65_LT07283 [Abscondita terminalis]